MRNILSIFITFFLVVACSEHLSPDSSDMDILEFDVNMSGDTRVTSTSFEAGDAMSLFAVEYDGDNQMVLQVGGNFLNNEKVVYDGGKWSGTRTLYWSSVPCDFYALYPYQGVISDVEAMPFRVSVDQNSPESSISLGGYEASDLLYASATKVSREDGPVRLDFSHIMSKFVVRLIKGEKFEGEIPDDVVTHIYNTNIDCTVNFTTGSVEKGSSSTKKTITMKKISNNEFAAVVIPQNIEKRTPLVEITMGGIAYLLEYSLSFRPGYVHTLDITLNTSPDQEQIDISIDPGIGDWN